LKVEQVTPDTLADNYMRKGTLIYGTKRSAFRFMQDTALPEIRKRPGFVVTGSLSKGYSLKVRGTKAYEITGEVCNSADHRCKRQLMDGVIPLGAVIESQVKETKGTEVVAETVEAVTEAGGSRYGAAKAVRAVKEAATAGAAKAGVTLDPTTIPIPDTDIDETQYPDWFLVETVVPHVRTILLFGGPGLGKSYAGVREGKRVGRFQKLTLTEETDATSLMGHWVPDGDKFKFHYGPAICAWGYTPDGEELEFGCPLIIDEQDKAGDDVEVFMHGLLDNPESAFLTLPNGRTVTPKPGFKVIATMNGVPDDLSEALVSRYPNQVEVVNAHPGAIAALPEDLQNAARGTVNSPNHEERINMRQWIAYGELRGKVGSEVAAKVVFQSRWNDVIESLKIAAE